MSEAEHHVRWEGVDLKIGAALAQLERACGRIWDHLESHPIELRSLTPKGIIALDHHFSIEFGRDKAKWPRADGLAGDLLAAAVRNNSHRPREVPQERCPGLLEAKDDGGFVGRIDARHQAISGGFSAAYLA